MPAVMTSDTALQFVPVGTNAARPFGMDARDRACRLATNAGLECAEAPEPGARRCSRAWAMPGTRRG